MPPLAGARNPGLGAQKDNDSTPLCKPKGPFLTLSPHKTGLQEAQPRANLKENRPQHDPGPSQDLQGRTQKTSECRTQTRPSAVGPP